SRWRHLAIMMASTRAQNKHVVANAFTEMHAELTKKGCEVPITSNIASHLRSFEKGRLWKQVVNDFRKLACESERAAPLMRFAEFAFMYSEHKQGDEALAKASELMDKSHPLLNKLAIAQTFWAGGQIQKALSKYQEILETLESKNIPASPALLASLARLSQQCGHPDRAIKLEEKALVLEHPYLPSLINLQSFRQRYQWLWSQYQSRVKLAVNAKNEETINLWLGRAKQMWHRWYEVDSGNHSMVHQMATLQKTAGRAEESWLYLSSIIDAKPKDAKSHYQVGQWYEGQKELEKAEKRYAEAVRWDTAHPQWLIHQARVLTKMDRRGAARAIYQKIIRGKWAPALEWYVRQAKQELKKL
ncbi:MAG: hypothetical protein QF886_12285, partial [Planctomycetota bacterium]|nr:hypothetical protein [Planctomycetota bacterium]